MSVRTDNVNINVNINGEKGGRTLREMRGEVRKLNGELAQLVPGTKAFIDKLDELRKAETALKRVQNEIKGVGGWFSKLKDQMRQWTAATLAFLGVNTMVDSLRRIVRGNAELSDSLADIQKTTGMTVQEVRELDKALMQINTRTPTEELRKIAVGAGQLGIAKGDILAFTEATDRLVVALGDEFTGGAEEVTTQIGALRNIFSDVKSDKIDVDMLHIGNALNALGSAGSATAPVVADFASRIGGVAIPLGLTSGQVLALSATMQELNINADRGGTAITKILQKMASNYADFAKIAGMKTKEFGQLVNTDLYGAFMKVVEGAKKTGSTATSLASILDNLGVDGAGASEVFLKLGSNTELLSEKLALSNKALKETTSITDEFNTKNNTLAGDLQKLGKWFTNKFENSGITDALKTATGWMVKMTEIPLSEKMEEERHQLNLYQVQLSDVNITAEKRKEIVDKLEAQYPEYLQHLDTEKLTNQELNKVINEINGNLLTKIMLQKLQEKAETGATDVSEEQLKLSEKQMKVQDLIVKAKEKYNYQIKTGLTLEQQVDDVKNHLMSLPDYNHQAWSGTAFSDNAPNLVADIDAAWTSVKFQQWAVNDATKDYQKMLDDITRQKQLLGIKDINDVGPPPVTPPAPVTPPVPPTPPGPTPEEIKEAENRLKQLNAALDQIRRQQELDAMNAEDREIGMAKDKFDQLRKLAQGNAKKLAEIAELEENEISTIREKYADQRVQLYLKEQEQRRKGEEAQLKARRQFAQQMNVALMSEKDREIYNEQQKWDALIAQAKAYGYDATKLEQAKAMAIMAIVKRQAAEEKSVAAETAREKLSIKLKEIDQERELAMNMYDIMSNAFELTASSMHDFASYQKQLTIVQLAIDTASAISKAVATGSAVGLTPIEKIIAISGNIAVVLANMVKAKRALSEAGDIPTYETGGMLNGPSHKDGGLAVVNPITGKKVAEVEGDEAILSRNTVRNNSELVGALVDSSMNHNGARIRSPFEYRPRAISYAFTRSAIQYERNGIMKTPTYTTSSSSSGSTSSSLNFPPEWIHTMQMLDATLRAGVNAKLNYNQYTRDQEAIDKAAKSARIG